MRFMCECRASILHSRSHVARDLCDGLHKTRLRYTMPSNGSKDSNQTKNHGWLIRSSKEISQKYKQYIPGWE
jgi:hypothetical protein